VTASTGSFIIADLITDDMLGTVSLSRRGNDQPGHVSDGGGEFELSYILRSCAWGHGYASEAARALLRVAATELPDQPVLIVTQSANLPSLRVGERLGFRIMATFEEFEAEQTLGVANLRTFRAG
jgi:RimJ/RimL family protein N-acetyltransferase